MLGSWGHQLGSCRLEPQASQGTRHPYVETWNITKSGRMFGVWCRLFRINSKGIYTTHTHVYIHINILTPLKIYFFVVNSGHKKQTNIYKNKRKKAYPEGNVSPRVSSESIVFFFSIFMSLYCQHLTEASDLAKKIRHMSFSFFFRRCSALLFSIIFWTWQCYNVFRMSFPLIISEPVYFKNSVKPGPELSQKNVLTSGI